MAGFTSESVAAFRRNGWPTCVGISGRLGSEYAYFFEAMTKLRDKFLNVPLDAVLHPPSSFAQRSAKNQQAAVAAAPPVEQRELTAQEWFERGFNSDDLDETVRFYTEAIRLQPNYAKAYCNRGVAHGKKKDYDGAIKDLTEAIRLQSEDTLAHRSQAFAYLNKSHCDDNDIVSSLLDYEDSLLVQRDGADFYYNRGIARYHKGDYDGAVEDYTETIRLKPHCAEAYYNRALVLEIKGEVEAAQRDLDEAKRLGHK